MGISKEGDLMFLVLSGAEDPRKSMCLGRQRPRVVTKTINQLETPKHTKGQVVSAGLTPRRNATSKVTAQI